MKKIEILAPAGSIESLHSALNAGADAVYIGGTLFGARAYANNLDDEALIRAIDYVHVRGKQMYLTVNTLIKNEEMNDKLYSYLKQFYVEGLDAVIVQDVGVMKFIHENFPKLPIHASTQMTLTMAEGANVLQSMGVTRMVTARELSLSEIKQIRQNTSLEIESFVHGALCYSYSGQCLMSSMIGGRSGNRGRCAQPCRMEYDCKEDGKNVSDKEERYLLSPKDMCTLDSVAEFIEAGIDSFKIEGRMKRYEYAAGVVEAYKKQIDMYYELGRERYIEYKERNPQEIKEQMLRLQDLYNRGGFYDGYYHSHNGKKMMSMHRPNHSGVLIGKVEKIQGINASIRLMEQVNPQDILEIRHKGNKVYEFTVKDGVGKGQLLKSNFKPGSNVSIGNEVYRTKNSSLLEELSRNYYENEQKVKIQGILYAEENKELRLSLSISTGDIEVTECGDIVMPALKQPMTKEKIEEQLKKTNDTPFVFEQLEVNITGDVFIPVSKLNELRRNGIIKLEQAIANVYKRSENMTFHKESSERKNQEQGESSTTLGIIAYVKQEEQLDSACNYPEVKEIYFDVAECDFTELPRLSQKVKRKGKLFYLMMPHIFRSYTFDLFLKNKELLMTDTIDGFVIKNFEEYAFFQRLQKDCNKNFDLRLDYNMYVMNGEAKEFYSNLGITHTTASVELNYSELKDLGIHSMDLVVYGYLPLMVSAQCVKMNTTGCRKKTISELEATELDKAKQLVLIDRMNNQLSVRTNCRECYNSIYNAKCLSLLGEAKDILQLKPNNIRLDFTFETGEEVKDVLHSYIEVFQYNRQSLLEEREYTKGHFRRGII